MTLDGFEARVFQHEYDHLDGVLTAPATCRRTLAMERDTGAISR